MKLFRADLHCHSTCSDGSLSPEELLQLAKDQDLQGLSITDHDTITAYETARPLAEKLGIQLISGVELSTNVKGVSVHLLGYAFDLENPAIRELCNRHHTRRMDRFHKMVEKLEQEGMPVDADAIVEKCGSSVGRPHIAQAMIDKGYVSSIKEAFNLHLGEGRPCYVPGSSFSAEEAIDTIHQAQGKAVIAHPHLIKRRSIVDYLINLDFDGIECYYARFAADQEKPWLKLAKKRDWLVTGGSDFHGDPKPHIPLGCSWAPEETFHLLHEHFLKVNGIR